MAIIIVVEIQHFVWKTIVCRFGILRVIISDNRRQFDSNKFRDLCKELGIKNYYSSLGHPQANGHTEVTNRTLLKLIKARLEAVEEAWLEELPRVLWAYRMTTRTPIRETSFKLSFGTKAVILVEVRMSSLRRTYYDDHSNDEGLKLALDCLPEVRDNTA